MKRRRNPSIKRQLVISVCMMQAAVVILSTMALFYGLMDREVGFVPPSATTRVLESLHVDEHGLAFRQTDDLKQFRASDPQLWAVVADRSGHIARFGDVPALYEPLIGMLPVTTGQMQAAMDQAQFTFRTEKKEKDGVRLTVMVGGTNQYTFLTSVLYLSGLVTPYFAVPVVLALLAFLPLLINRATSEVRALAEEAKALDLSERGVHMRDTGVPKEILPLITAFNEAIQRLGRAYRVRDQFLRDAAHELRMPIAVLAARIEGMERHPLKATLLTDLGRLGNVAEQLLDLQRLQGPRAEIVPLDLVELARETVSDVAPLASMRGYSLSLDAPGSKVIILGEPASVGRVLTNLLQNALVHGGGAGTITVRVTREGSFSVSDEGQGIPEEQREQIFQPFYRGGSREPGHGLGLHLTREIVWRHGGRISVGDNRPRGAMFVVQLPLAPRT